LLCKDKVIGFDIKSSNTTYGLPINTAKLTQFIPFNGGLKKHIDQIGASEVRCLIYKTKDISIEEKQIREGGEK